MAVEDKGVPKVRGVLRTFVMGVARVVEKDGWNYNKCRPYWTDRTPPGCQRGEKSDLARLRLASFKMLDKEIDKAFALDKYLQLLGIKCENVISFGKGENDTSIIAYAGVGVDRRPESEHERNQVIQH